MKRLFKEKGISSEQYEIKECTIKEFVNKKSMIL